MERRFTYLAGAADAGLFVEQYLKNRGYSRQVLMQLKKTEHGVLRNNRSVYMRERLRAGDCLTVRLVEKDFSEQIEPVALPFSVVYEDDDLMVIDKPPGMPVHPSMNNHGNTLANALAARELERGERFPYRCINRLDRNTSGLLIVAKHMLSAAVLYNQMRDRQIHRTYLAIVKGRIDTGGTVDVPIGRAPGSAIERMVDPEHGERAVTHYEPLRWGRDWTLVQCVLETGRTHQIRVHMSYLGHPLPGDYLYCPEDHSIERQPLHSWKLSFIHPITGQELSFEQPVPEDMKNYMAADREENRHEI